MALIRQPSNEDGFEDGDVEGIVGERDPVRSVDYVRISKLRVVLDGEIIVNHGGEEE